MSHPDWDARLSELETMPAFLEQTLSELPDLRHRRRPRSDAFSLVEQIWHLADLEREGYGERIRRILSENDPKLPDFEGDRIAQERRYIELDACNGWARFSAARRQNLFALRRASAEDRDRSATQDEVGRITLADVPRMMLEHDRDHRQEIAALIAQLSDHGKAEAR